MSKIKKFTITILLVITMAFSVIYSITTAGFNVSAEEIETFCMEDGCFDNYTDNEYFYDVSSDSYVQEKSIQNYEKYFEERFHNGVEDKTDEWILGFIPIELFLNEGQYFYMGREYGFFVDNTIEEQLIIVFDNEIAINNGVDGYIDNKFSPLFYHTYQYNNGKVYVKSYQEENRLFIKDVVFGAILSNLTYSNKGDSSYDGESDDGAFFISTNYTYSGTSLQSGLIDDGLNIFTTAVSGALSIGSMFCPPLKVISEVFDTIVSIKDFIDLCSNVGDNVAKEYRNIQTNGEYIGELYHTSKDAQLHGTTEHPAYPDGLRKLAIGKMETSTENPVLLDFDKIYSVTCKYTIGTTEHWGTNFMGRIGLDIVKEVPTADGSRIEYMYENVESSMYGINIWEEDEEPQIYDINKEYAIDILPHTTKQITATAVCSSNYSFEAKGIEFSIFDAKNQCLVAGKDKADIFLNAGDNVIIKLTTNNTDVHTSGGLYLDPEEIKLTSEKTLTLLPSGHRVFCYSSSNPESIKFIIDNSNLSIKVFSEDKNLIAESAGKNLNFLYGGGQVIYVVVVNDSVTTQDVHLVVTTEDYIETNKPSEVILQGNETQYLPFNYFALGEYKISISDPTVVADIVNDKGSVVDGIIKNEKYFVSIHNSGLTQIKMSICVEYTPRQVYFGLNHVNADEYVSFVSSSSEMYKFSNIAAIYDYDLKSISTTNGEAFLSAESIYYLKANSTGNCEIGVSAKNIELGSKTSSIADKKGFAYFKVNITLAAKYSINAGKDLKIYDDHMNLLYALADGEITPFSVGEYYIKIETVADENVSLTFDLYGQEIGVETQVLLRNTGVTVFTIKAKYTDSYKFYTVGDLNNSLITNISLYGYKNGVLNLIGSTTNAKYVEQTISLTAGEKVFAFVTLFQANAQAAIFAVEYADGGHESDVKDGLEIYQDVASYAVINKDDSYLIKFTSTITDYCLYLEKNPVNTFKVDIYEENVSNGFTVNVFSILDGSRAYEYRLEVDAGKTYYAVITYESGNSVDDEVCLTLTKAYSDIHLKVALYGSSEYLYADGLSVAPCMKYSVSLIGDGITIAGNVDYNLLNGDGFADFEGTTLTIFGDQAIGENITVVASYMYRTYVLSLIVDDLFEDAEISIGLLTDKGTLNGYMYPAVIFQAINPGDILYSSKSFKVKYSLYYNSGSIGNVSGVLKLNGNYYYNESSLLNIWPQEFNRIVSEISYSANGYNYKKNFDMSYDNTAIALNSYTDTKIVNRESVYLKSVSGNVTYNKTVNIHSGVNILTLIGSANTTCYNLNIVIEDRSNPLLVYMQDFNYYASNEMVALDCSDADYVCVYCIGTSSITGGAGEKGNDAKNRVYNSITKTSINGGNGTDGTDGAVAINAKNIFIYTVEDATLTITGGHGGDGGDGYYGANGNLGRDGNNNGKFADACGEDGTRGGDGGRGGNAGDGAYAILATGTLELKGSVYSTVKLYAGYGGDGGIGGDGGRGGDGGDGANTAKRSDKNDGGDGGDGGRGGNGGLGGNGGNGMKAISSPNASTKYVLTYIYSSYGGSSGSAGFGGNGGNGGKGGADTRVSGREGYGGNGGRGGNGADAGLNGANGGESTISGTIIKRTTQYPYPSIFGGYYTYGGKGGNGGEHGDPGANDAGLPNGTNGENGTDGTRGTVPTASSGGSVM